MFSNQVKRTIERYHLLDRDDRLVVGVSGGVDSMVLLHLLDAYRQELNLFLIVAHVNHGLRPEESEKEAGLVRQVCNQLGLPFEYGQFDVRKFRKIRGMSLQEAGREVRFRFFRGMLSKYSATKLALGHHADDQVETVLLRWIRGTGLRGLRGMLPVREGWVIRPLLESWKHEIESFARDQGIPFLADSSNLKPAYLRNRIRLKLIPFIEKEFQPNFRSVMMRTSARLREEDGFIEGEAEEAFRRLVVQREAHLSFSWGQFQLLHRALQWRVLEKAIRRMDRDEAVPEEEAWPAIDAVYRRMTGSGPSFRQAFPGGMLLERRYDQVALTRGSSREVPPFEIELIFPGQTVIREIGKTVKVEEMDVPSGTGRPEGSPDVAYLDSQQLRMPLKIRSFRPGDRFHPLGMKGTQKIKQFFIDHKIPRFERPMIPLLLSGEEIVWVVGYRMDDRVKVTDSTKKVVKVEVVS